MRRLARLWSPDLRQIDLDVNRTYRDHLMFRERYGLKQQALFHILAAYSVYNAEIGKPPPSSISRILACADLQTCYYFRYCVIVELIEMIWFPCERLLPRYVTDSSPAADVLERGRCFLGSEQHDG